MSKEKIVIVGNEGKEHNLIHVGKTILESALAFKFPAPHQCRQGDCGTCKAKLLEGDISYIRRGTRLTDDEIAQDIFLACSCRAESDVKIQFLNMSSNSDNVEIATTAKAQTTTQATIQACQALSEQNVYIVTLKFDEPVDYAPGQYLDISTSDIKNRSFSIAASNGDKTELELHIRHYIGGQMSGYFAKHPVGEKINVSGPFGSSSYSKSKQAGGKKVLALCAGVGFAPLKDITNHALADGFDVEMIYIMRQEGDAYDSQAIENFKKSGDKFKYEQHVRRDNEGNIVNIADILPQKYSDLNDYVVYCSGPVQFVEESQKACENIMNYDSSRFHADAFSATGDEGGNSGKKEKKGFFSKLFS